MNNTVAAALIALVIGLGIGIGAMALLSDDATLPLPQPLADTPKDVSNDTNNDNPKRPRPNPDKPNPIEEPTRPEPVPVDNSKPDGAYTIQAQKSDKTITGLVIGPDGQPFGGAKVMARPIYNDPDVSWASAWNSDSDEEGANVDPKERRRQYLEMTEAIEAAAQELTSGANGTFSFSDLYDLPYALSVFVEGYTPVSIGNTTVKPGNEVKFALRELRNLVVTVLLPEGGEPKQANVTINGSSNNNNYKMRGGWEYSGISSSLMVEDFGGGGYYSSYPSGGYGNRSRSIKWTPEKRDIDLEEGVWRVSAHLDNYTFVSQEVNINMISGASKQEITLELRERRIAKIKLNAMDPDITPQSYRIHVRPSDAAQAEFKDFNTLGSYVSHNSDGMFLHRDVEAGAYILSVVFNNEVIKEQPVSYRPEGITELFVDAPAPDRSKFVEVSVVGVPPYLYSSLQYSHGYRLNGKEMKRNVYNGLIRRKDGSAWVPHYEQNGKEAPAGAEHFVEARVYGIGETRGHYTPSSGASLRLSLEEPGLLEVTFSNFDPDLDAHKGVSVRLSRVYRDGEEKVGLNGVVGQVDDFGVLFVTGLTPGEYKVNVVFRNSNGRQVNQDEGARVMIRSGHNSHSERVPPIYTLKLQVPTGTVPNSNYNWVQIYSGNSAIGWKRLVFDQTIEIGKYPAGEYEFRIYNKKMKFQLASDMTVLFSPDN